MNSFTLQAYADQLHIPYLETSAKTAANVDQAFITMTAEIKKTVDAGILNTGKKNRTVLINSASVEKHNSWICAGC